MLIVVCDGLTGLPDAIGAVWPKAIVQTCLIHLLRNSFKFASKADWPVIAKDLKPVYTAVSDQAALDAFAEFSDRWERKYPAIIRLWTNAWAEFVPFLQFDVEIRKIVCSTNAIVTSSSQPTVFDVQHVALSGWDRRRGRGYLLHRPVRRRCGGTRACSAGVGTRLAA